MLEKDIDNIIAKYLSGEASEDDIINLSEWLAFDEKNKIEFRKIKSYWNAKVTSIQSTDPNHEFELLQERIKQQNPPQRNSSRLWTKWIAVAAIIIGVFTIHTIIDKDSQDEILTYITGNSVSEFVLPDGTRISLNKNSKLSYTTSYGKESRSVTLEGEALFDVIHDPDKKFIVNAGEAKITVLGTIFSVKNLPTEDLLKTSLIEGSVKFETSDQNILLSPNKQIVYNKVKKEIIVEEFDPEIEIAWKENLIRYKSVSFPEFISIIEQHYNAKIELPSSEIQLSKLTGAIDANLTVSQILDLMKKNVKYEWQQKGDVYIITY